MIVRVWGRVVLTRLSMRVRKGQRVLTHTENLQGYEEIKNNFSNNNLKCKVLNFQLKDVDL